MMEDYCAECGHLLSKSRTQCPFCGWSQHDFRLNDSGFDSWDRYANLNLLSNPDEDVDRILDLL